MAHPCGLHFFTCRVVEGGSGMTGDVLMLVTSDHYRKYSTFRTICAFIWISFKVISPKHRHSALTLSSRGRQCGWCTVNWRSNYEELVIGGYFCGVSLWLCCYCFKNFVVEFFVCVANHVKINIEKTLPSLHTTYRHLTGLLNSEDKQETRTLYEWPGRRSWTLKHVSVPLYSSWNEPP
jgi:hypothetical protein